ncbi:MAG: hypothetical protein FJ276_16795, partial [Planctomycetes bacterium]|nr:hypothetical protein [Planctomycetota bacterium]
TTWWFDTNHDHVLDTSLATTMRGYPIVGDFNGDGHDDLATWRDDTFYVALTSAAGVRSGVETTRFRFGHIGVRERPVSADMDMDGFDDFGLWSPDRSGVLPREAGEWYFLISGGASVLDRITIDPIRGDSVVNYRPVPFGNDMYAKFGDDYALPVVGNFDPPPGSGGGSQPSGNLHTNLANPLDVNADGVVTPIDALLVINNLNGNGSYRFQGAAPKAPYLDVDMNGFAAPMDALLVINYLNSAGVGEGEGEASRYGDAGSASLAADAVTATTPPAGEGLLSGSLLAGTGASTSAATPATVELRSSSDATSDVPQVSGESAAAHPKGGVALADDAAAQLAAAMREDALEILLGDLAADVLTARRQLPVDDDFFAKLGR